MMKLNKNLLIILSILLITLSIAFAEDNTKVIVNAPNEVNTLQVFPIEVYIPVSLREDINVIELNGLGDCELITHSNNNLIYKNKFNYSKEQIFSTNAYLFYNHNKEFENGFTECELNVILRGKTKNITSFKINLKPTPIHVDLPDLEWLYQKKEWEDFRKTAQWRYEEENAECHYIADRTEGISNYGINIDYGHSLWFAEDFLKNEKKTLLEYANDRTKSYIERLEGKVWEIKEIEKAKEISLDGFKEAYEVNINHIDLSGSGEHISCFGQKIYIFGIKDNGQFVKLYFFAGGRFASEKEVRDYFEKSKEEIITAIESISFDETEFDFEPLNIKDPKKEVVEEEEEKEEEIEEEDYYLTGYLTNTDDNPLPYTEVVAKLDGKEYSSVTDLNGNYEIKIEGLKLKKDEEIKGNFHILFSYIRDGTNYYKLIFYSNNYDWVILSREFTIKQGENSELNWKLDNTPHSNIRSNLINYGNIKAMGVIYYNIHEALEFALEGLKIKLDHDLPLKVWIGKDDENTLYNPNNGIYIAKSDMSYYSSDKPKNREYHEFGHFVMFDVYGSWPAGGNGNDVINHDGFLNPNTGDSYIEGFAEFYAMWVADFFNQEEPEVYAGFGSMENNYKPWHGKGYDEEFAVASLLWDLYDKNNEKGDSLSLSTFEMWDILKQNKANFYEYYVLLKDKFPNKEDEIDELFVLHGFYADPTVGNKEKDSFEPFRDSNDNGNLDENEKFIDYGYTSKKDKLNYKEGMKIGYAANYERIDRKQAGRIPNAFLKLKEQGPRYYEISVKYDSGDLEDYSYQIERKGDLIYVHPLPDDVEAEITIKPISEQFTYDKKFKIKNSELIDKVYSSNEGYFEEHDFEIKETKEGEDEVYLEDFEPKFTNDDLKDELTAKVVESDDKNLPTIQADIDFEKLINEHKKHESRKSRIFVWLILIIIVGLIILFRKKIFTPKNKELVKHKTKHYSNKIKHHSKNAYEKAKPHIKRGAKNTKRFVKETYHKTKPHVIKASNHIKSKSKEIKHKIKNKKNKNNFK